MVFSSSLGENNATIPSHNRILWQEGHTIHETAEESQAETLNILNLYASFCEDYLAIPVIKGQKQKKKNLRVQRQLIRLKA